MKFKKLIIYNENEAKLIDEVVNTDNESEIYAVTVNNEKMADLILSKTNQTKVENIRKRYNYKNLCISLNNNIDKNIFIIGNDFKKEFIEGLIKNVDVSKITLCVETPTFSTETYTNIICYFDKIDIYEDKNVYGFSNSSINLYQLNAYREYFHTRLDWVNSIIYDYMSENNIEGITDKVIEILSACINVNQIIFILDDQNNNLYSSDAANEYRNVIIKSQDIDDGKVSTLIEFGNKKLIKIHITNYTKRKYYFICIVDNSQIEYISKNYHYIEKILCELIFLLVMINNEKKNIYDFNKVENINSMGEISSSVMHDVNNILASISGYTGLIIQKCTDESIKEDLLHIQKSAFDGGYIIKNTMNLCKRNEDKTNIVDVNEVIKNAINVTKPVWYSKAQFCNKSINLMTNFTEGCYIRGKVYQLKECIMNLILNAADAIEGIGVIHVSTSKENNKILIKIKDTGCGIPDDIQDKIFDAFFTTKGEQGNGLGLNIVKKLMMDMNGKISLKSKIGFGTEFTLEFPKARNHISKTKEEENINKAQIRRVLIADDKDEICGITKCMIEMTTKYEVETVCCGKDALKKIKESKYDIIITDIGMPDMNGFELIKEIRKFNNDIFIAIMTGWIGNLPNDIKSNVNFILNKPFTIEDVKALIIEYQNHNKIEYEIQSKAE